MRIVLLEPEIPQNTGNIARLAAATGAELWLVGRLGFSLTDKYIKRSGMDYWKKVSIKHIPTLAEYYETVDKNSAFISTKGKKIYTELPVSTENIVFGCESAGFPEYIYQTYPGQLFRIPMLADIRSINLSSSAAVVSYHLLSLNGFPGMM